MYTNITPIVLTYNEELNIDRTISKLQWADEIVVVDSFSVDRTLDIVGQYPNTRIFQRRFDTHASQWNYAIQETGVRTEWILALDADYVLTDELIEELKGIVPGKAIFGFEANFNYCVFGTPLRGSLYPPVTVLYKKAYAKYFQDGHTQRVNIVGSVGKLRSKINHDDRKCLANWLKAQDRYMSLEAKVIKKTPWKKLGPADKIRKIIVVAPLLIFIYCLLVRKGILNGKLGLYYALQRSLAETLLSLKLIELSIRDEEIFIE